MWKKIERAHPWEPTDEVPRSSIKAIRDVAGNNSDLEISCSPSSRVGSKRFHTINRGEPRLMSGVADRIERNECREQRNEN